jgi:hypothetical protein
VERTAPPPSAHGGPLCDGAVGVRLAGASRTQLLDVLDVSLRCCGSCHAAAVLLLMRHIQLSEKYSRAESLDCAAKLCYAHVADLHRLNTQGKRSSATLMVLNASDPHGSEPSAPGHRGLYGLFWRFAGDACVVQPDIANMARGVLALHTCLISRSAVLVHFKIACTLFSMTSDIDCRADGLQLGPGVGRLQRVAASAQQRPGQCLVAAGVRRAGCTWPAH